MHFASMITTALDKTVATFDTSLGWMAMAGSDGRLRLLTIGHPSQRAALRDLAARQGDVPMLAATDEPDDWSDQLIDRLQAYALGADDDFRDVHIDESGWTPFQRRVLTQCRRIARGQTLSYAELAAKAGAPGAARAVGTVMAKNRCPLIVPCHRVVGSGGSLGGYSGCQGLRLKRTLLELEGAMAF
jgi:methylated-DNA-[protein]-cysteine S-methyltransferase